MIKRISVIILTIFLLCTFSAGCQKDDKATDNKEETPEKLVYRPDPVTIVVYTTGISKESLNKINDLEDRIRDILNINFDIRLIPNLGQNPDERRTAIKRFLKSGEYFDLLFTEPPMTPLVGSHLDKSYNNADLIAMGYFMDITDLLPLYAPNYYSYFSPEDIQAISCYGRVYNIPALHFESWRPCLFVWRSMLEKYGIENIKTFEDYIKTFEDYEKYMELIKENEKDYLPCSEIEYRDTQVFIEPYGYVMLCGNIVYRRDDPEMKLIPWEQTDAFKKAINTIKNWREKKYDPISSDNFDKKVTSHLLNTIPYTISKNIDNLLVLPGDEWMLLQLYPDNIISRVTPIRTVFISKNSKNAERILRFIEWMNTNQENYDMGKDIGPVNFYFGRHDEASFKSLFDKEGYIDAVTRNSPYPPHSGYTPPPRLMDKIAERCADFENFLVTHGQRNEFMNAEAIEKFIQEQKDKGIDALVKELQEDLDAWRLK